MFVFRSRLSQVILFTVIVGLLVSLPALAAPGATINNASRVECIVTLNITVEDGGTYYLQVWDDGAMIDVQSFAATTGQTLDVNYTIKYPAGTGAPGIAFVIADGPTSGATFFDYVDPFIYPDEVANSCAEQFTSPTCDVTIPDGSVVGDLPFATQAYWAPGKVSPDVVLNVGTYWVVGVEEDDAGNAYYKIVLACQYLYVPVEAMQPSFQGPWQGEVLPSNVG